MDASNFDKLNRYVTNIDSNVFVLKNLPEVIKGALFSRYSRSMLGLRELLLKEFILNDQLGLEQEEAKEDGLAIKKAQDFYDRILDGYGDDSIGELGGAHLALENISMLAAKIIEDCRIGGSPLEKSTRYVYFDQKVDGDYLFYKEETLMRSKYKEKYLGACRFLFDTYAKLIPPLTSQMEKAFPKEENVSSGAYNAAIRAKVLDCLRGLLPASTFTCMGLFGNGRFCEGLIQKLNAHPLAEMRELGIKTHEELAKVIPSFVRRADPSHRHQKSFSAFQEEMRFSLKLFSPRKQKNKEATTSVAPRVKLVDFDKEAVARVASSLLYEDSNFSLEELKNHVSRLTQEEIAAIFEAISTPRVNRRHKSPRALEKAHFTFEITADFGAYRDLQRHRMLTQERQLLSCEYGYHIPEEILGTEMEAPYRAAMQRGKETFDEIASEFREEAQYVVPMAYHIRWYFHVNLRGLQWLCELRSQPQGHSIYRRIAQEMAHLVIKEYPEFAPLFKFVDFQGYALGRLDQEMRNAKKALV